MPAKKRKAQSFLQGSLVLLAAAFIVKIIGALFKLPLTSMIGEIGMGYFGTAYSFFTVFQTIAIAGFPAAISRLVAENMANERYRDVKRIYRVALKVFLVTGTIGTVAMFIGSFFYCRYYLEDMNYLPALLIMSPCVFFYCMMSVNRGYFQGMRNMKPTAISQVIEALCKLILGLSFSKLIINWGMKQYSEKGVVFGTVVTTAEEAEIASLPYAAAGAILAVTIGTVLGMIFLMFRRNIWGDGITKVDLGYAPKPRSQRYILRSLLAIAIPVALASLANNLSTIIDTVTIQGGLKSLVENHTDVMMAQYGSMSDLSTMQTFVWGAYSGMALTLYNLVPTITGTFGVSALPTVTTSWAKHDIPGTKKSIESILRITALIAIPAGLGLSAVAKPLLSALYSNRPDGVAVAVPLVVILGVSAIFIAVAGPTHSMLQAVGKASFIVKALVITAVIKFVLNFTLVRIPYLNINGAPIGTLVSHVFLLTVDLICLSKTTKVKFNLGSVFGKPAIAGIACAVCAFFVSFGLDKVLSPMDGLGTRTVSIICVAAAVCVAIVVYCVIILAIKGVTKNEVLMLPKGEKIAAILEKKHLIG